MGLAFVEYGFAQTFQRLLRLLGTPSGGASSGAILGALLLLGLSRGALNGLQAALSQAIMDQVQNSTRKRLVERGFQAKSLSMSEFSSFFHDKSLQVSFLAHYIQSLVVQSLMTVMLLGVLLYLSWELTFASALVLLILVAPFRQINRALHEGGVKLNKNWERLERILVRTVKNLILVQILGVEQSEIRQAHQKLDLHLENSLRFRFLTGLKVFLPQASGVIVLVLLVGLYFYGGHLLPSLQGRLQGEALIGFLYLFFRFAQSLANVSQASGDFRLRVPAFQILASHLFSPHSQAEETGRSQERISVGAGIGFQVSDLQFQYEGGGNLFPRPLSFHVAPRESLLILGPSGVGKTTLLYLLMGRLEPTQGTVNLWVGQQKGQAVSRYQRSLLGVLGMMGPESFLIEGTVRENVLYGFPAERGLVSDEQIERALRHADAEFVLSRPQGLDTRIEEQGQGFSQGQKQRLSLARALLREPEILILDEPTANLDPESERKMIELLVSLQGKKTLIVVSHREALVQAFPRVLRLGSE
jgi:ABC-type multidrug transport system fused ATPase/permease subunit